MHSAHTSLVALLVVVGGSFLNGCAMNPVSGRPEIVLVSAEQERQLGREEAAKVAATMGLVDDPRLQDYVKQVGGRIAAHSPRKDVDYTFQVVDMAEPNAFALPGGYVYVSRGLLALMNSEDELAGVIGHEVGHVAARHAAQRVSRAAPVGILTGIGAAVTGMVSPVLGNVVGGIGQVTNALLLSPYSREQEREADRVGAELAARAGWNPAALGTALHTLEREEALDRKGGARRPSFFATHPPLPERAEAAREFAVQLTRVPQPPIAGTRAAFIQHLDGLVVGQSAAEGVIDAQRFVHPDLDFTVSFPDGWEIRNARDAVGGRDPKEEAVIVLEIAGKGDDPAQVLAEIDRKSQSDLSARAERLEIGGRRALHVTGQARSVGGPLGIDATWIAHGGRVFQVVGAAPASSFATYETAFHTTARSFRPPTAAERSHIRETRIRLARAHGGESLGQLVERSRSVWKAPMAAVANGLQGEADRLDEGQLVKIAANEPYGRSGR